MTTNMTLAANKGVSTFTHRAMVGDIESYSVDFTPWGTATTAVWEVETGSVTIANKTLVAGVASADLTFTSAGCAIITILGSTASAAKKVQININIDDTETCQDDYGRC